MGDGFDIIRAEVATAFFRLMTHESRVANWSKKNDFPDVASSVWYNNTISTLANAGILLGYEDGIFRPGATITRAEFATIAIRFIFDSDPTFFRFVLFVFVFENGVDNTASD